MRKGGSSGAVAKPKWREVVSCCLLLGLVPGVSDFSLFSLTTVDELEVGWPPAAAWAGFLALCLFPLAATVATLRRDWLGLVGLCAVPAYGYCLLPEPLQVLPVAPLALLAVAHKAAFAALLLRGSIRSVSFVAVAVAVGVFLGVVQAVVLYVLAAVGRFCVLAVSQNAAMVYQLGWRNALLLPVRAFAFWSPMLLVVVPSIVVSKIMHARAVQAIYDETFIEQAGEERDFEADLEHSLDQEFDRYKAEVKTSMDTVRSRSDEEAEKVPDDVKDGFLRSTPSPLLEKKKCGFFNIAGHIGNAVKGELNDVYEAQRSKAAAALHRKASGIMDSVDGKVQAGADQIEETSDKTLDDFNTATYWVLVRAYWVANLIALIVDAAFFFMVAKSYLYVFARVTFSSSYGMPVTLKDGKKRMAKGKLRKCGAQYTILASNTKDFFVTRTLEPLGRPPKFSIPQWSVGVLARLAAKAWTMNRVNMRDRKGSVSFRSLGGAEFVEWELKAGEVVIFDLKHFVAMSETVTLSRIASLRVSSLLFGRVFFSAAEGPGKLVLMTKGAPILAGERKSKASVPPSRLVAWQKDARFHVESELNVVDVFMSGLHLQKTGEDLVIIDADERGKATSGIVRFLVRFVFPF